ncbi:MAG: hypothetical protein ACJ79H_02210 [Myxococcales bacterium]
MSDGVVVVVELLLPGVVVVLPGVVVLLLPGVIVVELLPVEVEPSGVVVVAPMEPLAPGVPVVLVLLPIPVVVSVVPLDGLVELSVEERGLVVGELLPRGVAGAERPSGERLRLLELVELSVPTPVPLLGELVLVLP